MLFRDMKAPTLVRLAAAVMLLMTSATGCRSRPQPLADVDPGLAGEPENYSATIVRAIDDGAERELSVTRIARSGELRREEWSEQGSRRALILRPDQGKAFLLDLDNRIYTELPLSFSSGGEPETRAPSETRTPSETRAPSDDADHTVEPEAIERVLGNAPSPVRVETRLLADQTVENHLCKVYEQRAVFSDGHAEITKSFRALDLDGLALRIEIAAEPQNGSGKFIISRRDVRPDVSPEEFVVPAGFKKADKLPIR